MAVDASPSDMDMSHMRLVRRRIEDQQQLFGRHPFFASLETASFGDAMSFAPALTFWVMAFQDILRLNDERTTDPELKKIVRHHRYEDFGHQLWFFEDLLRLEQKTVDVRTLFGAEHASTRDAAYALVSEGFRTDDDRLRLVLLLTLEAAGHVFFERVSRMVDRAGMTKSLRYFSAAHLEVEMRHELFEADANRTIASIDLPEMVRADALALVDRCFVAFRSMFAPLVARDGLNAAE